MNRIRYKPKIFTALILSLILGLSTCVSSIGTYTVYATNIQTNDNVHGEEGDEAKKPVSGGLSTSKGGAIISLRDANGNPIGPTVLTSNTSSNIPNASQIRDHWGNPVDAKTNFTTAQLLGSNTYSLTGQDVQKTIVNYLHNVDKDGNSGFANLLNKAFNMSSDQIKSFAGKGVHIVVETVITVSYKDGGDARSCFFKKLRGET